MGKGKRGSSAMPPGSDCPAYPPCRSIHPYSGSGPCRCHSKQSMPEGAGACFLCGGNRGYIPEGPVARIFTESTRSAFDGIEAVVVAVNSVANMLSSTHWAISNSFRAAVMAIDELAKLRTQINCLFDLAAMLNWLRYIWRSLLNCLRLRKPNADLMEVWTDIRGESGMNRVQPPHSHRAPPVPFRWLPSVLFWMIAVGVPYLIYQSLAKMKAYVDESMKWSTGLDEYYEAVAIQDHEATEGSGVISFKREDILRIAPREYQPRKRGYLLASAQNGKKVGMVPIAKVQLLRRIVDTPSVLTGRDAVQLFDDARALEEEMPH